MRLLPFVGPSPIPLVLSSFFPSLKTPRKHEQGAQHSSQISQHPASYLLSLTSHSFLLTSYPSDSPDLPHTTHFLSLSTFLLPSRLSASHHLSTSSTISHHPSAPLTTSHSLSSPSLSILFSQRPLALSILASQRPSPTTSHRRCRFVLVFHHCFTHPCPGPSSFRVFPAPQELL